MIETPCEGPAFTHSDNQTILHNTSILDSTLKKKIMSIAHHMVRQGAARDE